MTEKYINLNGENYFPNAYTFMYKAKILNTSRFLNRNIKDIFGNDYNPLIKVICKK